MLKQIVWGQCCPKEQGQWISSHGNLLNLTPSLHQTLEHSWSSAISSIFSENSPYQRGMHRFGLGFVRGQPVRMHIQHNYWFRDFVLRQGLKLS